MSETELRDGVLACMLWGPGFDLPEQKTKGERKPKEEKKEKGRVGEAMKRRVREAMLRKCS